MSEPALQLVGHSTALETIPTPQEVARPEVIDELELSVRGQVREIEDLAVLASAAEKLNALAKALANTKVAPPAMAAARRVEWQIGRVLGPNPGQKGPRSSVATELLSHEDVYEFRLLATLTDKDLPWEEMTSWGKSRARLMKIARERGRTPNDSMLDIRRGDFREVLADLPDDSVDLILTDPPYAREFADAYGDVAEFGARVLKPGGSLLAYCGQSILPKVLVDMETTLRYWWCLALEHRGGGQQFPGKWVRIKWKPIVWFVKGERADTTYVHDIVRGVKPDQEVHEWAQGIDEVIPLIESLTNPDDLVCDPFAGSGSFGIAAHKIGRRFIGADIRE